MLTPEQKRHVDRLWDRLVKSNSNIDFNYFQLYVLYDWFLKTCDKYDVDPQLIDFDSLIDPKLTYDELKNIIEEKILDNSNDYIAMELAEKYGPEAVEEANNEMLKEYVKNVLRDEAININKLFKEVVKEDLRAEDKIIPYMKVTTTTPLMRPPQPQVIPPPQITKPTAPPSKSKKSHGVCAYCGRPIYYGEPYSVYEGKLYHQKCLRELLSKNRDKYSEIFSYDMIKLLLNKGINAVAKSLGIPPIDVYYMLLTTFRKLSKRVPKPTSIVIITIDDILNKMWNTGLKNAVMSLPSYINKRDVINYMRELLSMINPNV